MLATTCTAPALDRFRGDAEYANRPRGGIIVFNECGEMLVLKDAFSGKWSFPKGAVEDADGDDLLRTAIRETEEEVGLAAGRDYMLLPLSPLQHFKATYFFACSTPATASSLRVDPEEVAGTAWISAVSCAIPTAELNAGVRFALRFAAQGNGSGSK